jgi:hypothetical protein
MGFATPNSNPIGLRAVQQQAFLFEMAAAVMLQVG